MQIYEHSEPLPSPNVCFICEEGRTARDDRFIHTGSRFDTPGLTRLTGVKLICERCVKEAARLLGLVDAEAVEEAELARRIAEETLEHHRARVRNIADDFAQTLESPGPAEFRPADVQPASAVEIQESETGDVAGGKKEGTGEGVDATEAAATLATEAGVDLAEVEGSGSEGRVTKPDVEAFIEERDKPKEETGGEES